MNEKIKLGGKNLLQQLRLPDKYRVHQLLELEDSNLKIYFVQTGVFQMPSDPHTSVIIAHSLDELNQYFTKTLMSDLEHGRENHWRTPSIYLHGEYPSVRIIEKKLKLEERLFEGHGFLKIRPEFSMLQYPDMPVLAFEELNASCRNTTQNRIAVIAKGKAEKPAEDKYVYYSQLEDGYIADILPPVWTGPSRR